MNDRNPLAEAGEDFLDAVWDIEAYRDRLRVELEVKDGDDLLDQLEMGAVTGDRGRLERVVDRVGGISGLLGIVTEVVRLEEERNEALNRYVKARRADELAVDSEQSDFATRPLESFTGISVPPFPRIIKDSPQA